MSGNFLQNEYGNTGGMLPGTNLTASNHTDATGHVVTGPVRPGAAVVFLGDGYSVQLPDSADVLGGGSTTRADLGGIQNFAGIVRRQHTVYDRPKSALTGPEGSGETFYHDEGDCCNVMMDKFPVVCLENSGVVPLNGMPVYFRHASDDVVLKPLGGFRLDDDGGQCQLIPHCQIYRVYEEAEGGYTVALTLNISNNPYPA